MATDDLEQVGTTNRGSNLALDVELDEDASPPHSPMGDGTDSNSDGPSPTRTQPSTPRKDPVPVHCVDHIRSTSTLTRVLILVGLLGIVAVVIVVAVLLPSWLAGSTDQPCGVVIGTRHGSRYPHTAATSFDELSIRALQVPNFGKQTPLVCPRQEVSSVAMWGNI